MALDDVAVFPTSIWDGDSANRDSNSGNKKSPDHRDWTRMLAEVAAAQTRVYNNERGVSDNTIDSVGTIVSKTGLSVAEKGNGAIHKTIFTLVNVVMASTDAGANGAQATQQLYTFPEGHIVILGGHQVYPIAGFVATSGGGGGYSDTAQFGVGIGTTEVPAGVGLATTEENIAAETQVDLVAASSTPAENSKNAAVLAIDGSAAAAKVWLNTSTLADGDHGAVADILTVSGTVTILWANIGND